MTVFSQETLRTRKPAIKNITLTSKDYKSMSQYKALKEDRRSFSTLLFNYILQEHVLFRWIFKKSLMNPLWIEVYFLCFRLNFLFMMNALLFIDRYIDQRIQYHPEVKHFINYLG
jgi:hypothetical protein